MGSMTTDRPRGGLAALCLAELVCWGLLYYSLPVAVTPISADMGWSHTTVTAALTLGLIVSALMGPGVGRMLDAHGPRLIMGAATAIGVLALALVAIAPNLFVFFLAWVLAGLAQARPGEQSAGGLRGALVCHGCSFLERVDASTVT